MIKSIFIVAATALALGGCASTGPNQAVGTGVGAVGGYAVGRALGGGPIGSAVGAVVGASVGGAVGQNMDQPQQPRTVIIEDRHPVYVERPVRCHVVTEWDPYRGAYFERRYCR